jgi:hypothetical protein
MSVLAFKILVTKALWLQDLESHKAKAHHDLDIESRIEQEWLVLKGKRNTTKQ